ncbi:MAG: sensor histidine kinase [Nitrospiraceae bacterium]
MDRTPQAHEQLVALAVHLSERRQDILQAWRQAADNDPELTTASSLSRAQFYDHIPEVLDAFERKLSARHRAENVQAEEEQKESAAEHGLHRWQQGYNQREAMREWGHLQLCLLDELDDYALAHHDLEEGVMRGARRALAQLCGEGVSESAARYAHLQQAEAVGRVRDLERALVQLNDLDRQRAEAWREVAHDLRGRVGIVQNVSEVLNREDVPEWMRVRSLTILQKGVGALQGLLNDLMSLARLEAGHEKRKIERFDAALMLQELCSTSRPLADERGLFLKAEGPPTLSVEGDAVKTQRVAQNLLLNALKYTERGGVKVTWAEDSTGERWVLCVQDTGPGFLAGSATPLARALKEATEEAHEVEEKAEPAGEPSAHTEPAPTLTSQSPRRPTQQPSGEGIGLSIVKRLCELLDASLELETAAGEGTTFRVILPRHYSVK